MKKMQPTATCKCGQKISARNIDALNAALARHYRTCKGEVGAKGR